MFANSKQNLILLASFSSHPWSPPNPPPLPPPTVPHPAHHCLVNLLKTPICLSDLNGSFKWLRISPGTTQSPSAQPLSSSSPTPSSLVSVWPQPGYPDSGPMTYWLSGLNSGCASLPGAPTSPPLYSPNSNQRITEETRKRESNSLCTPVTSVHSRQA